MGQIKGKTMGLVVSQANPTSESSTEGNEAKLYFTRADGTLLPNATTSTPATTDAIALTIGGNKLRGITDTDATNISKISDIESISSKANATAVSAQSTANAAWNKVKDITNILTWKGTVNNKDELLALGEVKVGEVYNVNSSISINENTYPAHTNFVVKESGNAQVETIWDSLGGVAIDVWSRSGDAQASIVSDILTISTSSNKDFINNIYLKQGTGIKFDIDQSGNHYPQISVDTDSILLGTFLESTAGKLSCTLKIGSGLDINNGDDRISVKLNDNGGLSCNNGELCINANISDPDSDKLLWQVADNIVLLRDSNKLVLQIASKSTDYYKDVATITGSIGSDSILTSGSNGIYISSQGLEKFIKRVIAAN